MRERVRRRLVRSSLAVAAVALGVVAGCGGSTDEPTAGTDESGVATTAAPTTTGASSPSTASTATDGVTPEGFSTVMIEVTDAAGEVCEVCVWLADTAEERRRGLMGVTDLGAAAGMLFDFEAVSEHRFYMLNTPTPLSIAWFGPGGEFVSSTDMDPCLDPPEGGCPLYAPGGSVQSALEVFDGGLDELGAVEGSTLNVRWDTEAPTCPDLTS